MIRGEIEREHAVRLTIEKTRYFYLLQNAHLIR